MTNQEQKGLFALNLSAYQVFDCFRTPVYPKAGTAFKVYNFQKPYGLEFDIHQTDLSRKLFFFKGEKGEGNSIKSLSLWMADDTRHSNPVCLVRSGKIWGLSPIYGFMYESEKRCPGIYGEGYGYLISTHKAFNYNDGNQMIWAPEIGEVTSWSMLEKYTPYADCPLYP